MPLPWNFLSPRSLCERCGLESLCAENDCGEFICDDCEQSAAERAWERMCEDFHDGGNTGFADGERVRMEAARKLK